MKRKAQNASHNQQHQHNFDMSQHGDFNNIPSYSQQRSGVPSPGPSHRSSNYYSALTQLQQTTQAIPSLPPYHSNVAAFFQNQGWNSNSRPIQSNRINHFEFDPPPPVQSMSTPHVTHGRSTHRNSFHGTTRGNGRGNMRGKSKPGNNGGGIVHSNVNNYCPTYMQPQTPSVEQMVLESQFNECASNAMVANSIVAMQMQSHCFTTKEWNAQDAIRAYNFDQEFSALLELQMLRLRFPVPELTNSLIRAFLPFVPEVQMYLPSSPRYCFVEMPVNTNLENVQKKILEIPFHGNKMKADRCFGNTRLLGTPPENIDPFAIYVGNIPEYVNVKYIKSQFERCIHCDEHDIHVNNGDRIENYTRYAHFYFSTVEETIEAYKKTFTLDLGGRRLVRFRQRSMDPSDPYKDYKHAQHSDGCVQSPPIDSVILKANLKPLWTDSMTQTVPVPGATVRSSSTCNCNNIPSTANSSPSTIASINSQPNSSTTDSLNCITVKSETDKQNELHTFDHLDDLFAGENDSFPSSPAHLDVNYWDTCLVDTSQIKQETSSTAAPVTTTANTSKTTTKTTSTANSAVPLAAKNVNVKTVNDKSRSVNGATTKTTNTIKNGISSAKVAKPSSTNNEKPVQGKNQNIAATKAGTALDVKQEQQEELNNRPNLLGTEVTEHEPELTLDVDNLLAETNDIECHDEDYDRKMTLLIDDDCESDEAETNVEQQYSKRYWGTYIKRPIIKKELSSVLHPKINGSNSVIIQKNIAIADKDLDALFDELNPDDGIDF